MTTTTAPDLSDLIHAAAGVGFFPADREDGPEWLARFDAVLPLADGYAVLVITDPEAEYQVRVVTANGVIRSEAKFDLTETGLAMFVGAVGALR